MSLQDDALQLQSLDQKIIRAMLERDVNLLKSMLPAYLELLGKLTIALLDKSTVTVTDNDAAEVLRKISGGEGLPSARFINKLAADYVDKYEDISTQEIAESALDEIGLELFYSWYSHSEYVKALRELRPLVLRDTAPESVERLTRQIKQCYAFQQYDAAYALCRTLLEASIRDICMRRNLLPDLGENVIMFANYKWYELRDKVSSGQLRDKLNDLYSRLSMVIHGRQTVGVDEARETFVETLEVIECMYEKHRL